mgnify:CR=1 FL=1
MTGLQVNALLFNATTFCRSHDRLLGNLLGSADIIAQMADRCYLEKCRDRLYPEFVAGGIARRTQPDGKQTVVFESPDDLIMKTPGFYVGANKRLNSDLAGTFAYAERHFGGQNLYLDNFGSAGFEALGSVQSEDMEVGDVLLMQVASPVPNHAAIYLGDGLILHHLQGRLSSRDVYGGYWQKITTHTLRHTLRH